MTTMFLKKDLANIRNETKNQVAGVEKQCISVSKQCTGVSQQCTAVSGQCDDIRQALNSLFGEFATLTRSIAEVKNLALETKALTLALPLKTRVLTSVSHTKSDDWSSPTMTQPSRSYLDPDVSKVQQYPSTSTWVTGLEQPKYQTPLEAASVIEPQFYSTPTISKTKSDPVESSPIMHTAPAKNASQPFRPFSPISSFLSRSSSSSSSLERPKSKAAKKSVEQHKGKGKGKDRTDNLYVTPMFEYAIVPSMQQFNLLTVAYDTPVKPKRQEAKDTWTTLTSEVEDPSGHRTIIKTVLSKASQQPLDMSSSQSDV